MRTCRESTDTLALRNEKLHTVGVATCIFQQTTGDTFVLFDLPKLAWLAIAGNPCVPSMDVQPLPIVDEKRLVLLEKLGEGASGIVWSADWDAEFDRKTRKVALKIFKGSVTSDGLPTDEIKIFSKLVVLLLILKREWTDRRVSNRCHACLARRQSTTSWRLY